MPLEATVLVRVFHRGRRVGVPDANAAEQCLQFKAREGRRDLGPKRILAVLVIVMAATGAVPEGMKQAVILRLSSVWAERRVGKRRNGH